MRFRALGVLAGSLVVWSVAPSVSADAPPPVAVPVGGFANVATCSAIVLGYNAVTGLSVGGAGPDTVVKSLVRTDHPDASSTLVVTATGPFPITSDGYSIYDCLWAENGVSNGALDVGEQLRVFYDVDVGVGGSLPNRTVTFSVTVPNAAGKTICDRVGGLDLDTLATSGNPGSAIETGTWTYFVSNVVCAGPIPPANVPELPFAPLAMVSTGSVLGVGTWLSRRRALRVA